MLQVPQSVKSNLFRHLLRPLVRLAIKNEVSSRELSEVLKSVFVGVASKQIGMSGGNPTPEAIAVLLNVDIKEVSDVLASPLGNIFDYEEPQNTPMSRLLAIWHTDPRYSGPYGVLVDLPFVAMGDAPERHGLSFSELARQCCPGISPKVLLDESIRTVCETCERNLRSESVGGNGLFERAIFTDNRITRADLSAFDKYVRERGQLFADDIDIWLSSRSIPEAGSTDTLHTGIGIYHYVVNDDDENEFGRLNQGIKLREGMKDEDQ